MVRDLDVYIDSDLSTRSHVRRTVSRCFAILRQLRIIQRQVTTVVFQSLVTTLVLHHLDYCNSVLYGLPITDPASSVCTECHCAAHFRFTAFRAHHSCTYQPSLAAYPWAHLLQIGSFNTSSHWRRWTELLPVLLHSCRRHAVTTTTAFVRLWLLARTDHSSIHSRTFTAYGAAVWNDLPAHVTAAPSLTVFRQRLKTFLFSRSYLDIVT